MSQISAYKLCPNCVKLEIKLLKLLPGANELKQLFPELRMDRTGQFPTPYYFIPSELLSIMTNLEKMINSKWI